MKTECVKNGFFNFLFLNIKEDKWKFINYGLHGNEMAIIIMKTSEWRWEINLINLIFIYNVNKVNSVKYEKCRNNFINKYTFFYIFSSLIVNKGEGVGNGNGRKFNNWMKDDLNW